MVKKRNLDYLYQKTISQNIILQSEALEDLNYCFYLLKHCSISFVTRKNKISAHIQFLKIKKHIKSKTEITKEEFFKLLSGLIVGIKDFHSFFSYYSTTEKLFSFFGEISYLLLSEEIFERNHDIFICQKNPELKIHGKILKNKYVNNRKSIFVPIIHNNRIFYRLVKLRKSQDSFIYPYKNKIDLHFSSYKPSKESFIDFYNIFTNENVDYWTLPDSFTVYEKSKEHYEYLSSLTCNPKKIIIIDNRMNRGGMPYEITKLLFQVLGLNIKDFTDYSRNTKKELDKLEGTRIISNLIAQKNKENLLKNNIKWNGKDELISIWCKIQNEFKNGKVYVKKEKKKFTPIWQYNEKYKKQIKYDGYFIILASKETCSLGELLYDLITKQIGYPKVILLGCNTGGAVSFADANDFYLKNTGIELRLSSVMDADLFQSKHYIKDVEGIGFFPDFWTLDDEELKGTIKYLIGHILDESI